MKPNILFLFADQMHAFAMRCMGTDDIRTPNLDQLASEGVLFRNSYSNAPVCTPYRGTLFTGRYASQTGMFGNQAALPKGEPTLADSLNGAGYLTSYVGKWHIGDTWNKWVPPNLRGGFTEFIGYQAHNNFIDDVWFFDEEGNKREFNKHRTDATTDIVIEKLEQYQKGAEKPFALFASYQNPHYPEQPDAQYEALYDGVEIQRRPNSQDVEPYTATHSPPSPKPRENDPVYQKYGGDLGAYLRAYYAMVTQLDDNVGRVMRALDALGLRGNTVVVFTSDHGDLQGSHGLKNKSLAWEESSRVPHIVRAPGGLEGHVSDAVASGIDHYPTLLDFAGGETPSDKEGFNLAPLIRGETAETPQTVFCEMSGWGSRRAWRMIRKGPWKLTCDWADPENGSEGGLRASHLFDLSVDPYEMNCLVNSEAHQTLRKALQAELKAWAHRVRAK